MMKLNIRSTSFAVSDAASAIQKVPLSTSGANGIMWTLSGVITGGRLGLAFEVTRSSLPFRLMITTFGSVDGMAT